MENGGGERYGGRCERAKRGKKMEKGKKRKKLLFSHLGNRRRLALLCRFRHFLDGLFLSRARRWRLGLYGNSEWIKREIKGKENVSGSIDREHRFFCQSNASSSSSSSSLLTFAAAAFFVAADVAAAALLFVALVVRLLAPETRRRASERC